MSRMPGFLVTEAVRDPEVARDLLGRGELRIAIPLAPMGLMLAVAKLAGSLPWLSAWVAVVLTFVAAVTGFVAMRYLFRYLEDRYGPIKKTKDESRAQIMKNLALLGAALFVVLQIDLRAGLPFKLWELLAGGAFLMIWVRLGRLDRYRLIVGLAMMVAMVAASVTGSIDDSPGVFTRTFVLVWAVGAATVGVLDYLMLRDARDVVRAAEQRSVEG